MTTDGRLSLELGCGPQAIAAARRALAGFEGQLEPGLVDDVRLLVSELVTNSVRHGSLDASDPVELRVTVYSDRVRVCVSNPGDGFDPPLQESDRGVKAGGWGLYLVDRLADRWGIDDEKVTCVWFEIERQSYAA